MANQSELLTGLNIDELEALADSLLVPSAQSRLNDVLARKSNKQISKSELVELDHLVQKTDHLTILKTRARCTLSQTKTETAMP